MPENPYHIPALLTETIDGLNINPDGIYVDVTFGGGGHSGEILSRLSKKGKLIGFDQDEDVMKNIIDDQRFIFVKSNFRYLTNFLKYHQIEHVDGILADLGVSFHHFDESDRGFSFRYDGKLDMRMNKLSPITAATILNTYEEDKLANVFYLYGELRNSRKIAATVVKARAQAPITQIQEFVEILKPFFFREKEKKDMARVFQALRIEVNKEMKVLQELLNQSVELLNPGGRLVVLTYHSLEDRLVKNFIRSGNFEGELQKDFYGNVLSPLKAVNNKVIVASDEEIAQNPRARSAKLRIAEKQ
ncbi:MAG TPA: 16S rRNA (cytosine(1402)-N(4))-methyltransferase RsmH [Paludibacteraceae bacterium]|nr:16S rRNA (cytosine(1402)-N(4))-methyltransferase RsmH [Paludibacteraceae bacterium]HPT42375.1 16S rRNA (cytosine(1402)-N(4))-methyltransferase RsmH [Paludibacteraceae bacterium]